MHRHFPPCSSTGSRDHLPVSCSVCGPVGTGVNTLNRQVTFGGFQAAATAQDLLEELVRRGPFELESLATAFNTEVSSEALAALITQLGAGDFRQIPDIEMSLLPVVNGSEQRTAEFSHSLVADTVSFLKGLIQAGECELENLARMFGNEMGSESLAQRILQLGEADVKYLPNVEVRPAQEMGEASGLFVAELNCIFVSDAFVETASPAQLVAILLEEMSDAWDTSLDASQSHGWQGRAQTAHPERLSLHVSLAKTGFLSFSARTSGQC